MKTAKKIFGCLCVFFLFSACTKTNSLSGTQWVGGYGGANFELVLMESDFVIDVDTVDGSYSVHMVFTGSYVYSSSRLTGIITSEIINGVSYTQGQSFHGDVNGRTMTITGLFTDKSIEFIKR